MNKYLIVSGDPSGDIHAANLMHEIRQIQPDVEFIGIGGSRMISEGLVTIAKMSDVSVVGFWEVAKKYSFFKKLLNECIDILKNEKITAFIPVDYPGFNIRLAENSKKLGIPVYYYIAPQLWAWGKNRAKNLAKVTDKLLVVFPFEVEYFSKFGIDTTFVGHPLPDNHEYNREFKSFNQRNGKIAFFPGSRLQEVHKHLKLFKGLLDYNTEAGYGYEFVVAKSGNIPDSVFSELSANPNVELSEDNIGIMQNSSAGIIKTGTSNLEAALCGLPFAMFYKTSFLTFRIAEKLVNLPYISIINILFNKFVIREFIQNEANPKAILQYIHELINNRQEYSSLQNQFTLIRNILGGGGASRKAAEIITAGIQ
ncbi:MAG: lipid-A-disaccharide synthase [Candidatus Kapabacteria bacterium]|nr:lipid-A-disaccharide synthase [Candidatus Kapabacteria bacterium]